MAVIRTSETIADIRGSVGNKVYSGWKGKSYIRSKASSISNPRSTGQATTRAVMTSLSRHWNKSLTDGQRALWEAYAQKQAKCDPKRLETAMIIPYKGFTISGYNAFVMVNQLLVAAGIIAVGAYVAVPPNCTEYANSPTALTCVSVPVGVNNQLFFSTPFSYVDCGNVLAYEYNQPQSWGFWMEMTQTSFLQAMISKSNFPGPPGGYEVFMATNALGMMIVRISPTEWLWTQSNSIFAINTLYRVVVTYDGSNSAAGINLYRNGVPIAKNIIANLPITATIQSTTPLRFGDRSISGAPFSGYLDEVNNVDKVLTPAEVLTDWGGGAGVCLAPGANIQGIWHMNQASGDTVPDSSGNNYHGTRGGAPKPTWGPSTKSICAVAPGVRLTWTDPVGMHANSRVRIWTQALGAGVHRQQVANVALGAEMYDVTHVRIRNGSSATIGSLPGLYLFQLDVIDPAGVRSAPSSLCRVTVA